MSSPLDSFQNLPGPAKAGLTLAAGGGIVAAIGAFLGPQGFIVILVGVALVGLLLAGYKMLLKALEKRKANPFAKSLAQNSAAAPQGISEPAKRARLDDLRKNFESGVEKFRAAGKNLYAVPWYLLVGEPGSGKTEAIRHCNVGFPPGLQDQLQGAGGTLNMNWWFTNHAIVLDTAGRLMFEEAPPGQTTEWQEFLKLLRSSRPNCPVNGMLLVIPADSLIRDNADAIEKKAGKIAQQLDSIQRSLGVRFPVFVVITKCDLINGFREFFGDLDDPQSQSQILGWSNPADLDQPFKPEAVEEHLAQVRARMVRRRTLMLQDPVNTENPSGRRIDQVDALYAFPESIGQIVPRLRRYLEMIFVAGEWSSKPLFLRGIYFTSSMREGSALDSDLAEALGVSIESLPEGRVWERDRAYFLRDLFMTKVFKEKGLVTRAGNVKKVQQRRRMMVLGAGFATIAIVAGLMGWSTVAFRRSVGAQLNFWEAAAEKAKAQPGQFAMIRDQGQGSEYLFRGNTSIGPIDGEDRTLAAFHGLVAKRLETPVRVPAVFEPVAGVLGDVERRQFEASRAMFIGSVLRPAVDLSRTKLAREGQDWSDEATAALAQLIRMDTLAAGRSPAGQGPFVDAASLYRYVLTTPADFDTSGGPTLQPTLNQLFPADSWTASAKELGATPPEVLASAVSRFVKYWSVPEKASVPSFAAAAELRRTLLAFRDAEAELLKVDDAFAAGPPASLALHNDAVAAWSRAFAALTEAHAALEAAVQKAGPNADNPPELSRLALEGLLKKGGEAYDALRDQTGPAPAGPDSPLRAQLDTGWTDFEKSAQARAAEIRENLTELKAAYLAASSDPASRLYAVRYRMYAAADGVISAKSEGAGEPGSLMDRMAAVNEGVKGAGETIARQLALAAQVPQCVEASKVSGFAVSLAQRGATYAALDAMAASAPTAPADVATAVQALASRRTDLEAIPAVSIPLTATSREGFAFQPGFNPRAAALLFRDWSWALQSIGVQAPGAAPGLEAEALRSRLGPAQQACRGYAKDYVQYWAVTVPGRDGVPEPQKWAAYRDALVNLDPYRANREVRRLLELSRDALRAVPAELDPEAAKGLARVSRELEELVESRFDTVCEEARTHWAGLGADETTARATILAMTPEAFKNDLLMKFYSEKEEGVRYWSGLTLAAVSSLAKSAQEQGIEALGKLRTGFTAYPLIRDPQRSVVLTAEQVAEARTLAAKLGEPKGEERATTIAQGAKLVGQFDQANRQLALLVGETLLKDDRERVWRDKLRSVLAFVHDQPAPQQCEIVILDPAAQAAAPGGDESVINAMHFGWVEIGVGNNPAFKQYNARQAGPDTVKVSLPGPEVTIQFRDTTESKEAVKAVALPAPWNLTGLAQVPGATVEPGAGGKSMLKVPLQFTDGAGRKFCYWIGVRFERAVPAAWPEAGEWPVR